MTFGVFRGVSRAVTRANAATVSVWRISSVNVRGDIFRARARDGGSTGARVDVRVARVFVVVVVVVVERDRAREGRRVVGGGERGDGAAARARRERPGLDEDRAPPPGYGGAFGSIPNDGERALWALIGLNGAVYYGWATTDDRRASC